MAFPKLKNKHLAESLFTAEDFGTYKKWPKNHFPKKIIIFYQNSILKYFKRKYKGKYKKIKLYGNQEILRMGKIGFIKMNGIGAPHAVAFLEELIAGGTREFLNIGTAGGLIEKGVFLCNRAVRDEGTSHHYIADSIYSYPDENLTKKFEKALEKGGIKYTLGSTWTIDAPYRETKREIAHYKNKGILTVEMEASALFAVAKLRKVKIAAAFVVSDILGKNKWDPQFHKINLKKTLNKVLEIGIEVLK